MSELFLNRIKVDIGSAYIPRIDGRQHSFYVIPIERNNNMVKVRMFNKHDEFLCEEEILIFAFSFVFKKAKIH